MLFHQTILLVLLYLVGQGSCGWVDPDTHQRYYTTDALTKSDDREYKLVRRVYTAVLHFV